MWSLRKGLEIDQSSQGEENFETHVQNIIEQLYQSTVQLESNRRSLTSESFEMALSCVAKLRILYFLAAKELKTPDDFDIAAAHPFSRHMSARDKQAMRDSITRYQDSLEAGFVPEFYESYLIELETLGLVNPSGQLVQGVGEIVRASFDVSGPTVRFIPPDKPNPP